MRLSLRITAVAATALSIVAIGWSPATRAAAPPTARVYGGELRGELLDPAGATFKNIPFAAPPVGARRWAPPALPERWNGVRDATQYGAPCAQISAGWNDKVAAIGSEDCLTLNVWTPEWPMRRPVPVMVWIHGGANMGGSARGEGGIEPPFDGAPLSRRGVVVVTIQYRLGMFGFFAHPALTATAGPHPTGNFALLDQIAALRWVRGNIAQFGGDPHAVTIFGQSAGALDVGLLMTTRHADALFNRAIAQSGSVVMRAEAMPTLAQKEQAGVTLAGRMGAPAGADAAALRRIPTADVIKASPPYGGGAELRPEPMFDGYLFRVLPARAFRDGGATPVPLLIGNNARERSVADDPAALERAVSAYYGALAPRALAIYGATPSAPPAYGSANAQFGTDTSFRCGASQIAAWHSVRQPTFQYEFMLGREPEGSVHSLELRYVFGRLTPADDAPHDAATSELMQRYWTNFAKTGDPNGAGLPTWPRATPDGRAYLEIAASGATARAHLRQAACALFEERLNR